MTKSPKTLPGARGVATLKVAGEAKRYRYDLLPNGRGDLVANANLVRIRGKTSRTGSTSGILAIEHLIERDASIP